MARSLLKDVEAMTADPEPAVLLQKDRRIRELEDRLRLKEASYKHAMIRLAEAEKVADFLDAFGDPRKPEPWHKTAKGKTSPYCAIAVASDWHLGEVVDPKTVGGLNEFNEQEAQRRVQKFFTKIPVYVERYAPECKLLVLWAGGDFISGHIHPDLAESNSLSPTEECLWFRDLWSDGLATLLRDLPKLKLVIPTSMGNHGRTTLKPRCNTAAQNSFEQMTYKMLAKDWAGEKRVEWRISEGYHNVVNILGKDVRFHHGDAIRYEGGVGGLTIPARKAIAQWNKGQRVALDVFGHHHTYLELGSFLSNGSLVGYGPFSVKIKAEYEEPMQAFLVFDAKHGLRQSTRIFVSDP